MFFGVFLVKNSFFFVTRFETQKIDTFNKLWARYFFQSP